MAMLTGKTRTDSVIGHLWRCLEVAISMLTGKTRTGSVISKSINYVIFFLRYWA